MRPAPAITLLILGDDSLAARGILWSGGSHPLTFAIVGLVLGSGGAEVAWRGLLMLPLPWVGLGGRLLDKGHTSRPRSREAQAY